MSSDSPCDLCTEHFSAFLTSLGIKGDVALSRLEAAMI
jgi:hypothetical protein